MKHYCSYSNLQLSISHLSSNIDIMASYKLRLIHPIFNLPQQYLYNLYQRYLAGALTQDETRLLFLAYLNSTELLIWRCPSKISLATATFNMDRLVSIATRIITVPNHKEHFPSLLIDSDTCELTRIKQWLETLEECAIELSNGYRNQLRINEVRAKEDILSRLLRHPNKDKSKYVTKLSNWVADAAQFPTSLVTIDSGEQVPCSEYWKQVIRACGNPKVNIYSLNKGDILDILDHLEDNLELGTTFSNAIWELLESTVSRMDNLLGIDFSNPYQIVSSANSARIDPNMLALAQAEQQAMLELTAGIDISAPPSREQFNSTVDYLKAKAKYNLAISASRNSHLGTI